MKRPHSGCSDGADAATSIEEAPVSSFRADLMSPQELADDLGLSLATLADWRSQGRGPAYLKVGRKIWYPRNRVENWLQSRLKETTEDGPKEAIREVALQVHAGRSRIQRVNRFGRHRTKRERSEAA